MAIQGDDIRADLRAAQQLSDYEAVDVLWVALVKAANRMPGANEHKRMRGLVDQMPVGQVREVLNHPAVENLLRLDPPLEAVLANPHEHLAPEDAKGALDQVRGLRETNPKEALRALGKILKLIRNKRVHGFKTRLGTRDREILGAARPLLLRLCELAIQVID